MAHEYGETVEPELLGHNGGPEFEEEVEDEPLITDDELSTWLHERITDAVGQEGDEVSDERKEALDYYLGRPYGDEMDGYSKVVTRDVFELIEWGLASLVRIFLSAPRIVEFKPVSADDIDKAQQETEVVHDIMNNSFIQLMFWLRDALMFPNGYLKVWHEDVPKRESNAYSGLTQAQVGMLSQDPEVTIDAHQPRLAGPQGPIVFDVEVTRITTSGKICIQAVPPEEVVVLTEDPQHLSLDELDYAHCRRVARWELIEMGYESDWVMELPISTEYQTQEERRLRQPNQSDNLSGGTLDVMELVDYYECYVTMDYDGDGISERRKICAVGGGSSSSLEIVENEEDNFSSICTLSTVPQSHRHVGVSLADSGKWVQRVSSTLTRQMLDNLYRTNRPRTYAGRGVNLEQLENYVPHGVVEGDPAAIAQEQVVTVVDKVLPVLQHFDQEKEAGSGVSRHTMGLDAERLQDTTMGAYVNALGQASQRLELVARTYAETGFGELAKKIHQLVRTHQDVPKVFRLRGEWTEIDPASWRDERETVPCVGLGYGTSQERVASGMALLDVQREAIPHGLSTINHVYRNLEDVVRAMGKRDPSMYFLDPNSEEGQRVAENLAKQKQAEQEQTQSLIDRGMATEEKKTTVKLAELREKVMSRVDEEMRKWAELELKHEVDIAGKGLDPLTLKPLGGTSDG